MAVNFAMKVDNQQVMKALQDVTAKIEQLSRKMTSADKSTDKYFKDMEKGAQGAAGGMKELLKQTAAFAGISLGAAGVAQFAKSIVDVRKQMQSLQVSFKTLLGSEEKASKMFGELKQFAATTPLMLKDLAAGAQTMLGFNIEAEKVVPTLKAIGDISMGDAQKFQSLTLAFSQMSATGKLMGQDLLQMINAGFNPLTEISRKTGKSIATLKDEMSKGAISAQMVADAFMSATSEGGKFNGMLEEQGKTLAGSMNQLQGAIDDMFNAIGEQTEGVIAGAISATQKLVENYEKVGKVLATIIATYGAYKAALMAVNVVERIRIQQALAAASGIKNLTAAQVLLNKATLLCTKAQKAFNASALANPYVLLASALVTVVGIIWSLSDGLSSAEKSQKSLTKAEDDFKSKLKEEEETIKMLLNVIQSELSTKQERAKAYEALKKFIPEICNQYSMEKLQVMDLKKAYEMLAEAQSKTIALHYTEEKEKIVSAQHEMTTGIPYELSAAGGSWKNVSKDTKDYLKSRGYSTQFSTPDKVAWAILSDETKNYLKEIGYEGNSVEEALELLEDTLKRVTNLEIAWQDEQNAITSNVKEEKHNKAYWEAKKKEAENELEALTDIEAKGAKGDALKKKIQKYDNILKAYSTKEGEKSSDKLSKMEEEADNEATQAKIDRMKDSTDKVIKQLQFDYQREMREIDREEQDALKEAQKMDGSEREQYEDAIRRRANSKRQSAFQKYYKGKTEAYGKEQEDMDTYLAQYANLQERKLAIQRQYQEKMSKAQTEGERLSLEKEMKESIATAERDEVGKILKDISKDPAFFDAMSDIDNVATQTIERLVSKLKDAKDAIGDLDPENMKELADVMRQMEDALFERETNPFEKYVKASEALAAAQKKVQDSTARVSKAQVKYNDAVDKHGKESTQAKEAQKELNKELAKQDEAFNDEQKAQTKLLRATAKLNEQFNELASAIKGVGDAIGGEAGMILNFIGDITSFVSNSIDSVKRMAAVGAQAISTIEKASVILAIIQAAIQIFQKLNDIMNKFSSSAAYDKAVEKQNAINKLTQSVNAYQLAILKATNAEKAWFGSDSLGTMKTNFQEQAKTYENYMSKLNEQQVKYRNKSKNDNNWTNWLGAIAPGAGLVGAVQMASSIGGLVDGFKKGDNGLVSAIDNLRIETRKRKKSVFGIGGHDQKTADLRDWAREKYGEELFDSENFINTTLANQIIEDYGSKLQGDTKKTLEELVELKEQYDEYEQQLKDYVNDLYSPLVENMTDAIMTWLDTGKDALRSFKEAAADTFRDIVKDMVQTLVFNEVVGSFQDDIQGVYKEYQKGNMTEEEMSKQVALLTAELADRYETEIPVLQGIASDISTTLRDVTGIDITKHDEQTATQGIAASFSQDSIDEANGRMAALQMGQQQQITSTMGIQQAMDKMSADSSNQTAHLSTLIDLAALRNSYLTDIYERLGQMHVAVDAKLKEIATNTQNL